MLKRINYTKQKRGLPSLPVFIFSLVPNPVWTVAKILLRTCPVLVPSSFLGPLSSPFPSLTGHVRALGFSFFHLTCGRDPATNRVFDRRAKSFRRKIQIPWY
jgi:hypothetical protein